MKSTCLCISLCSLLMLGACNRADQTSSSTTSITLGNDIPASSATADPISTPGATPVQEQAAVANPIFGVWVGHNDQGLAGWKFAPDWFCYFSGTQCDTYPASYKIRGDQVEVVQAGGEMIYVFRIVSRSEIEIIQPDHRDDPKIYRKCARSDVDYCREAEERLMSGQ